MADKELEGMKAGAKLFVAGYALSSCAGLIVMALAVGIGLIIILAH